MMFADGYVQAYTKSGTNAHEAIFANTNGGAAHPQPANSPWETDGRDSLGPYCGNEGVDFNLDYDHVNTPPGQGTPGLWVLSGAANPTIGTTLHRVLCIASSAQDDLYNNDGNSYWSAYAFDLTGSVTPAIFMPSHSSVYDLADYPRFGNWVDGYYMTFDFINVGTDAIEGFAVCKLDSADISQGNEANSATCFAYLPTATPPMIHTLLPADMQSDSYPTGTAGEFFLATVNPGSDGNPCTTITPPCTSNTLAFWTWGGTTNGITNRTTPTNISVSTFTPGCYNLGNPADTVCVPQPGGTMNIVDSVGDRLMSPLAYNFLVCGFNERNPNGSYLCGEYLAVTQTIQEDGTSQRTGVRYYTIVDPSTAPSVLDSGDFQSSSGLFYWMPSNAIDGSGNVAYTFTVGGSSTNPSIYAASVNTSGTAGSPTVAQSGSGAITDTCNQHWGEYVSVSIDPSDGRTFWGTGQYQNVNESTCHAAVLGCNTADYSGCNWTTAIFTCKAGSGFCP